MEHWQYYLRGRLFELFGLNAQAIAAYREATRAKPGFARPLNSIAYLLASQERFAEAEPYYAAVLRADPDNAIAHFNLGYTFDKRGQYGEAIREFREATRLNCLGFSGSFHRLQVRYFQATERHAPLTPERFDWRPRTVGPTLSA